MANGKSSGAAGAPGSGLAGLLKEATKQLIPVLLTAGSLVGFVAFAGGVIVWTRFSAAKVPPDQAVNAVPRDELVAIGSALLLLFGFFGALALVCVFLIDRGARATPGMARALLVFFVVEGVTAIITLEGISTARTEMIIGLFLLPVAAALWGTFERGFVELVDDLPTREGERPGPRGYEMFLLPELDDGASWQTRLLVHLPIAVAAGGVGIGILLDLLGVSEPVISAWLGLSLATILIIALRRSRRVGTGVRERLDRERDQVRAEAGLSPPEGWRWPEESRMLNERPMRLELRLGGVILTVGSLVVSVGVPVLTSGGEWWVGVSIGAAAALSIALWRIASLSAERVIWYGVAVFLSVPLFGTLTGMVRNVADPQVQPMALIRNTDGPYEAIQGIYVTEADERVYFATLATEGCSNTLRPHSGRLEWVPKSEVVAMSVGPAQDVDDAAGSALEMAYALTPAVETPAGGEASLTVSEKQAVETEEKAPGPTLDKRLEDGGPAVRPFYGAGLSLDPENASPEQHVTLRMSAPNTTHDVHGFGETRDGRTVRVGGVRANILKEPARGLKGAEYLKTLGGKVLKLEKGGIYARKESDGEFVLVARAEANDAAIGTRRYVKLVDQRVLRIDDRDASPDQRFIELDENHIEDSGSDGHEVPPRLAEPLPVVTLKGVETAEFVEPRPYGQAWHEAEIRFEVPENASTGAVTVECSQLSGQPLLRVAHAPEARIAVRMEAGSSRVTFDSSRSTDADEGEHISRRWEVAGLRRGNQPSMSTDLPARLGPYEVSLTVTDESGNHDRVSLRLLRLPASRFPFEKSELRQTHPIEKARKKLIKLARKEAPAAIEIEGYADDPGTRSYNAKLSLRRAEYVREELLHPAWALMDASDRAKVPVRTLGYGEGCPIDPRPGRSSRNRRVDVFVLGRGVSMAPPGGCHPLRFKSSTWRLRPRCPAAEIEAAKLHAAAKHLLSPRQIRDLVDQLLAGIGGNDAPPTPGEQCNG